VSALLREFERRRVAPVSLSENLDPSTAVGHMLINVLGTFAQADGEMIGERTAAALAYKRDRLEVYASVPFGFKRRL
jgi:DNA invertase Pin-like site-specific DNA recombinase